MPPARAGTEGGRPAEGEGLSAAASAMGGWHGVAFSDLRIGEELASRDFTIDADAVRRFHACLGTAPQGDGPFRVPAFLLNEFHTLKGAIVLPPGVLHASEALHIHAPVMTGTRLRASVRVADAFIRNGKRFVVLEQDVREAGRANPALRITRTLFWPC